MLKRAHSILIIGISIFCISIQAYAADVLWRLTHEDQDALVIARITDYDESKYSAEVIHVISGELNKKTITINSEIKYWYLDIEAEIKEICVLSLDESKSGYKIKWGAYKATSEDYRTLKFVKNGLSEGIKADLTAFEYYINSNGKENDFYFEESTAYLRLENGESIVIYPVQDSQDEDGEIDEDKENNSVNLEETSREISKDGQGNVSSYILLFSMLLISLILIFLRIRKGRDNI